MHPTRHDLPEKARKRLAKLLQASLADASDLASQAKQAHWNVKGPHFAQLHSLFDQVYEHASDQVDEIAERIVALGGTAVGTVRAAAAASRLREFPFEAKSGNDHINAVADALASYGKAVRAAIDESARLGDAGTSDLFTGISQAVDKDLWMVEAHLEGK